MAPKKKAGKASGKAKAIKAAAKGKSSSRKKPKTKKGATKGKAAKKKKAAAPKKSKAKSKKSTSSPKKAKPAASKKKKAASSTPPKKKKAVVSKKKATKKVAAAKPSTAKKAAKPKRATPSKSPSKGLQVLSAQERYNVGGLYACVIETSTTKGQHQLQRALQHLGLSEMDQANLFRVSQGLRIPKLFADGLIGEETRRRVLQSLAQFAKTDDPSGKAWKAVLEDLERLLGS